MPLLSRCRRLPLLLLLMVAIALPALPVQAARPTIGLALSGGGARGAAHVGVLRVLEEMNIPIDYVAGTSMGSIIGGLYAMGMGPDEIEATIEEIDWEAIFQDEPPRPQRRTRRKRDDRTFLINARAGVRERDGEVNLIPALIQGQRLDLALRRYTLPARDITDFDALAIPFRAVATDLVTGEAVVLDGGDLATAIRASMAVPAAFAPVEVDDRLLVDGGLAMNLPVEAVREMGADIIIAVDVGGPMRDREEINNVLEMLDQVLGLVTWSNTRAQIETLGRRDLLIVPPLGREVLPGDFPDMAQAIRIGEQGARAQRIELAALARQLRAPGAPAPQAPGRDPVPARAPLIAGVRIENDSRLADALIARRLDVPLGQPLDIDALEGQLERVFDQDNFQTVTWRLEERPDGSADLIVTATEKPWGTSSLQGGLELSSAGGGDSMFNIGAAYTMAPVNPFNAEWRTILSAGEEPGIRTEFYQPLDPLERWYLEAFAAYETESLTLFNPNRSDRPTAKYLLTRAGGGLEVGRHLGEWGRIGLRYARYAGEAGLRFGDPGFRGYSFDSGMLGLGFYVDTLDNPNFPRQGWLATVFASTSRAALGASDEYEQAGFNTVYSQAWDRNSLLAGLTFATTFGGDQQPQSRYRLGGFLNLSGFNQMELSGEHMGLARVIYTRELQRGLVNTYAGASLEAGNVWDSRSDIRFDNQRVAGSLFVGADTFIGPLYLGYGYADGGFDALYLFLGRPWRTRFGN